MCGACRGSAAFASLEPSVHFNCDLSSVSMAYPLEIFCHIHFFLNVFRQVGPKGFCWNSMTADSSTWDFKSEGGNGSFPEKGSTKQFISC